jgi:hypothetical protein
VLGIAARNPDFDDRRLAHLLGVTLARHRTSPPPLPPGADESERRARDAAWARELRRVRDCLRRTSEQPCARLRSSGAATPPPTARGAPRPRCAARTRATTMVSAGAIDRTRPPARQPQLATPRPHAR